MSSIIKVDQIQLSDGSTPTAGDLGLNTTGSVIQVQKINIYDSAIASGTNDVVFYESSDITLRDTNSKVLLMFDLSVGGTIGGAIKLQYSINSGTNYTGLTTADMGTTDDGLGGTVASLGIHHNLNNSDGTYVSTQSSFSELVSPSGTSFRFRIIGAGTDSSSSITLNRRSLDDNYGGLSHATLMEIAG